MSLRNVARNSLLAVVGCVLLGVPVQAQDEPISAHGDLAKRWPVNDEDPSTDVPSVADRNRDPIEFGYWLQDMLFRAEAAREKGDWRGVIKYYTPLKTAVPEQVTSYRRLCEAYHKLGQTDAALENCAALLSMQGVLVMDHFHFLDTLLSKPSLSAADVAQAKASLQHLREFAALHPQTPPGATPPEDKQAAEGKTAEAAPADLEKTFQQRLEQRVHAAAGDPQPTTSSEVMHLPTQIELFSCRLGVLTKDAPRLAECTTRLLSYNFPTKLLMPFAWAHALAEGDPKRAVQVLALAKTEGVPEAALVKMRKEQNRIFAPKASASDATIPMLPIGVGLALLLAAAAAAFALRRMKAPGQTPT